MYTPQDIEIEKIQVQGIFQPQKISPYSSHFRKGWVYEGKFFTSDFKNLNTKVYFLQKRIQADQDLLLQGTLKKVRPYQYVFKPQSVQKIKNTHRFVELRHKIKQKIKSYYSQNISSKKATAFLSWMTLGIGDHKELEFSFRQLGLSHLLAISGLHFGFFALIAFFSLSFFFPYKKTLIGVFVICTLYYLLLGFSPSIFRAYLILSLYLLGEILGKKACAFNILGFSALIEMLIDPLIVLNLGFQMSFLSCFGILYFFQFFENLLSLVFKKRSKEKIQSLSLISLYGHLLSAWLRKNLSLGLSVNLFLLPIILYHFHKFPLVGIIYNLFYPLLAAGSLTLLFLSFLCPLLFTLTTIYTDTLLKIALYAPAVSCYIRTPKIPVIFICIYFTFLILLGNFYTSRKKEVESEF